MSGQERVFDAHQQHRFVALYQDAGPNASPGHSYPRSGPSGGSGTVQIDNGL